MKRPAFAKATAGKVVRELSKMFVRLRHFLSFFGEEKTFKNFRQTQHRNKFGTGQGYFRKPKIITSNERVVRAGETQTL